MALTAPSLFLYGFEVTPANSSIDFRVVALETPRQATLKLGFFSLQKLIEEIARAMQAVAPSPTFVFFVTIDRDVAGGTQNRVTIGTSTGFLELLFLTGPRESSAINALIGFPKTDKTGATSYTGNSSAGIPLITDMEGYNFLDTDFNRAVFGQLNISASGVKETITYNIQEFFQVQFKYIPELKVQDEWSDLFTWMMQQRLIEFTKEITSPNVVREGTLERSSADGKGMKFKFKEMLPQFPFLYDTGLMVFRKRTIIPLFI